MRLSLSCAQHVCAHSREAAAWAGRGCRGVGGGALHPPQGATSGGSEEGSSLVRGHTRALWCAGEEACSSFLSSMWVWLRPRVCSNFIPGWSVCCFKKKKSSLNRKSPWPLSGGLAVAELPGFSCDGCPGGQGEGLHFRVSRT